MRAGFDQQGNRLAHRFLSACILHAHAPSFNGRSSRSCFTFHTRADVPRFSAMRKVAFKDHAQELAFQRDAWLRKPVLRELIRRRQWRRAAKAVWLSPPARD